ncbi:MAG TPA: methyltransferase domain-containing protein [Methylomirabilota bacterium]|nr:methyltransferase domain-containing protein [Methylomirabilota bacterium]
MPLLLPLERAENTREMLDGPAPLDERARNLSDVERLNGLFGGRLLTVRHVARLLSRHPAGRPVTVLDVGTGSADFPRALVRWARRAGRPIRVVALDSDADTLQIARRAAARYPEIVFLQGDALALPVRPEGVDVVISALTLHHLEPEAAARYLAEMDAAARLGLVVNDLVRGRGAWLLVWLATRLLARSPMSRHDGPLSVRRAYTPEETRALCEKAGCFDARVFRYPPLVRLCVVRGTR